MIRLLVADDEKMVRAGLRLILEAESDMEVVGEASDGADAVSLARLHRPDIALLDVRMPRMDGIEATRQIVALAGRPTAVVVLTTFDLDDHIFDALHAGASGFLLKSSPPERLVEAIRVAAAGDALLEPGVTRRVISEIARRGRPRPAPEIDTLTPRERDVLRLVAAGLSNSEIAASLRMAHATVKTHVARVLHKLGLRDRVQAVVYAFQTGFATSDDPP